MDFSAPRKRQRWLFGAAVAAAIGASTVAAAPTLPGFAEEQVQLHWTVDSARDLSSAIEASRAEGLNPADYGLSRLEAALQRGTSPELDAAANMAARMLARDYAFGRVADREGMEWYISSGADLNAVFSGLDAAIAAGRPRAFIEALLPTDRRYVALRKALTETRDPVSRDRLRANMERWRWMPRSLGEDYVYVNVPSYELKLVSGGEAISTYTVIVGAPETPTPQLAAPASSLVVNPWWNVPQSIIKSSNLYPGKSGYVFKALGNGKYSVRQPPGPRNSLGKIKINLANDHAIYLHDTPAKAAFGREERALSHGCIRVKDIDRLAAEMMAIEADGGQLDAALADSKTQTLRMGRTWNVYLVYFTTDVDEYGKLVNYGDPYARDADLIARLDGRAGIRMASAD